MGMRRETSGPDSERQKRLRDLATGSEQRNEDGCQIEEFDPARAPDWRDVIKRKPRGTDLYQELERAMTDWKYPLAYSNPVGGTAVALPDGTAGSKHAKAMRLESCVPLFINQLVWAPDLTWASTVIDEICSFPHGAHFDLGDTVTQALRYLRDNGMLQTDAEYQRAETERNTFRSRRWNAAELFGL